MPMLDTSRFEDADKYAAYLKTPAGGLRSELAWENMRWFLPRNASKRRAHDVGGGTSLAGVQLARMESALGVRPEFAAVARYIQIIARRSSASSGKVTGP